jgi:tRNA (guanine37-N1)-methyltransferase
MLFTVITIFPEMLSAITDYGITGKAVKNGLLRIETRNPRDFVKDKYRTIDDRPYGGGPGMIMMAAPLCAAIQAARGSISGTSRVVHLTPQGRKLNQAGVNELAGNNNLILLAGRYEGIDERLITAEVDEEWSVGDYVLSGGELAAMVLIDAITRTLPGALGHAESAREDSFFNGLLDYPHYTRPEEFATLRVPDVLLSGDHARIQRWRMKQALGRTWMRRPDLLDKLELSREQRQLLDEFKSESEIDVKQNQK